MFLLVAFAALCAVAVVLVGRSAPVPEFPADRAPLDLPGAAELAAGDVERVRFAVGFRGYRMDQVDEVLDRLTTALADRDRRLAELSGPGVPPTPASEADSDGSTPIG